MRQERGYVRQNAAMCAKDAAMCAKDAAMCVQKRSCVRQNIGMCVQKRGHVRFWTRPCALRTQPYAPKTRPCAPNTRQCTPRRGHLCQTHGQMREKAASCGNGYFHPPQKKIILTPPLKNDVCSYVAFKGGVKTLLMGGEIILRVG